MIWKDRRAARAEHWRRRRARNSDWHRRFAWLPHMLDDPTSHTVWLGFYEARHVGSNGCDYWIRRAIGSNYRGH